MNELQDKLEKGLITRTFNVGGMPESVFKEIDAYCKEQYGDSRWTMIADLHRMAKEDYKFSLLYDELLALRTELETLKNNKKEEVVLPKVRIPTFGKKYEGELK